MKRPRFKTKARNAVELLGEVKAIIRKEPRRCFMHEWKVNNKYMKQKHDLDGPECNTVGCIAGWIIMLKPGTAREVSYDPALQAAEILGVRHYAALRLFLGQYPYTFPQSTDYGTPGYVERVCRNIDEFIEYNKQQLEDRKYRVRS